METSTRKLDIVGICGSLRAGSLNAMALRLAGESMPPDMRLEVIDWSQVPAFNADVLERAGPPAEVRRIRERIARCDGVVIATPEYNFSLPGMLKNLIDWLSRGADQPFARKPLAILSTATGPLGGARVQYDLRRVFLFVDATVLIKPEVFIGHAQSKFDGQGRCTDDATRQFVTAQMLSLERLILQGRLLEQG